VIRVLEITMAVTLMEDSMGEQTGEQFAAPA
jgi:hypothetical protein